MKIRDLQRQRGVDGEQMLLKASMFSPSPPLATISQITIHLITYLRILRPIDAYIHSKESINGGAP